MSFPEKVLSVALAVVLIGSLVTDLAGRYAHKKKPGNR
jgi:hypothetical protein